MQRIARDKDSLSPQNKQENYTGPRVDASAASSGMGVGPVPGAEAPGGQPALRRHLDRARVRPGTQPTQVGQRQLHRGADGELFVCLFVD